MSCRSVFLDKLTRAVAEVAFPSGEGRTVIRDGDEKIEVTSYSCEAHVNAA